MAKWHGYLAMENVGLNAAQKATLIAAIKALGPGNDPQPARLNHWRTRLDGEAAIFEAAFDEDNLTVAVWKQRLGDIFGVSWVTIGHTATDVIFDSLVTPVIMFHRLGVDYLRVALFAGVGATWDQSHDEVMGYLALYHDEWEEVT